VELDSSVVTDRHMVSQRKAVNPSRALSFRILQFLMTFFCGYMLH